LTLVLIFHWCCIYSF